MNMHARVVRLRADSQAKMACQDNLDFMRSLPSNSVKLIVTSPPYNIGKSYEKKDSLENYVSAQAQVISECVRLLHDQGSICWQVVKHLAFYVGDVIDVGIEILPMKELQQQMSSGVGYYEGELYNLVREGRGVPAVPLVLIGVVP
jgi:hypothetical protein